MTDRVVVAGTQVRDPAGIAAKVQRGRAELGGRELMTWAAIREDVLRSKNALDHLRP